MLHVGGLPLYACSTAAQYEDGLPCTQPFRSGFSAPPCRTRRQPEIPVAVTVSQLLVVDAPQVEHRGVEIVHVHAILNRVVTANRPLPAHSAGRKSVKLI